MSDTPNEFNTSICRLRKQVFSAVPSSRGPIGSNDFGSASVIFPSREPRPAASITA